ncbi:MAG: CRTAC1 family protein [Deltaproteobacteria bacterium]|nr:CRTAC1 family protein [Deltaproteobacteria bacterium]
MGTFFEDYTSNVYGQDYLVKGNGDGTFTDVSAETGITAVSAPLYGTNVTDINNDGRQDIITSPYCRTRGSVWKNMGDGTFSDVAAAVGYDAHTMGGDSGQPLCQWAAPPADFDNDGDIDLFINLVHGGNDANEGRSTIVLNSEGLGGFKLEWAINRILWEDPQAEHRAEDYAFWFDMDNNGLQDLVVTQCCYSDGADKMFMLLQNWTYRFDDVTDDLGFTGAGMIPSTHGLTVLDYDLDGDDDVIVAKSKDDNHLVFLQNDVGNLKNHISIKLVGSEGMNRSAIGARVTVTTTGFVQTRELYAGEGHFGAQSPFIMNFGLNTIEAVESVRVRWPSDAHADTLIENPPINQLLVIEAGPPGVDGGPDADDGDSSDADAGTDGGTMADEGTQTDGGTQADENKGSSSCACTTDNAPFRKFAMFTVLFLVFVGCCRRKSKNRS